jgi:hypothetical protein
MFRIHFTSQVDFFKALWVNVYNLQKRFGQFTMKNNKSALKILFR